MMMLRAVSGCPGTEQTIPHDFVFHGISAYVPHKSSMGLSSHKHHILLLQGRGRKLGARNIAYSKSSEQDDVQRQSLPHITSDQPYFCSDNDEHSEEPIEETASSLVRAGTDHQPVLSKQGTTLESLLDKLKAAHLHILAMEQWNLLRLKMCHRNYSASATNLLHYLALKGLDIDQIKEELSSTGLSNLETVNPHVLSSLSTCINMLTSSRSDYDEALPVDQSLGNQKLDLGMTAMMKMLSSNQDQLLGKLPSKKGARIMVTVGQEAAENGAHISNLITSGATIFRINCAHGNPELWSKIVRTIRMSSQHLEIPCRILMDLAGPKLRTGKLKEGPCVVKISPRKNAFGDVTRPAQVWLSPQGADPPPAHLSPDVILHVNGQEFLNKLEVDVSVRFRDARGKHRTLRILSKYPVFSGIGFMAECGKPAYVESGTALYIKDKRRKSSVGFVVDVPPTEQYVRLRVGDLLTIFRDYLDEQNRITCSSGYLFDSVKLGDPIAFDDGKIWGVVKGTSSSEVVVKITHAGPKGTKLGSEKSINIPDSDICYEGLTSKDLIDLDFVAAHADIVGVSFVRDVADVSILYQELTKRKLSKLGVALKIETRSGFENLPLLILEAMKFSNPLGVMIARGDLAVECGWEKLADMQEEIVSVCCAAHVPMILATQVLESLVKSGVPSRAEIIDAANGRRASCVMLNKGRHLAKAVSILDTILNWRPAKAKTELKPLMLSPQ